MFIGKRVLAILAAVSVALAIAATVSAGPDRHGGTASALPVAQIESVLNAKGTVTNGVLSVGIDRDDITNVHIHGVAIKPSFEVTGNLSFQPLNRGRALFNGDIPLRPGEVNRFIDAILANGLVFQAEHQHFYDFNPSIWFIHFRGVGSPVTLARAVRQVLRTTSTPFPQKPPARPKTPLNKKELQSILHGYDAEVGADGVVTVFVARKNPIRLAGVVAKPETNIATNVSFEPLDAAGSRAAAAPDFSLETPEIDPVMRTMRAQGWDIGCLYNQETGEQPQLYFSHQFKVGDPYALAREIRRGLDHMNAH